MNVMRFDLASPSDLQALKDYVHAERSALVHAHFAPASGTCAKAREKPLKGVPLDQQPRPLRSFQHPKGLPNLKPMEQAKVDGANEAYDAMIDLVRFFLALMCSVSIENPENSLLWHYPQLAALFAEFSKGYFTCFHNCMHGGSRDNVSRLWSYNPRAPCENMFDSLSLSCDKSHVHASWRPFLTAEKPAYPQLLCDRLASLFVSEATARNLLPPQDLHSQVQVDSHVGKRQIFAGQSRKQTLKPLVSEYGHYASLAVPLNAPGTVDALLKLFPKGARVVHRRIAGGFCRDDFLARFDNAHVGTGLEENQLCEILHVGIPRSPLEFLQEAVKKGHPRNVLSRISKELKEVVVETCSQSAEFRLAKRSAFLKRWMKRALELRDAEAELHSKLSPHLQVILKGKKLLLFREILLDLGYVDAKVVDDVISGFSLAGWGPESNVFEKHVRKPAFNVAQLEGMSKGLNAAVLGSLKSEPWSDIDQVAWEETQKEVQRGWLSPFAGSLTEQHFVAKRFPLLQTSKVRLVDDFSICGVNSTYGMKERLRVQSVDELAACLAIYMEHAQSESRLSLVGRTFDLKSAYKQFGVDANHADRLKVAVKGPEGKPCLFNVLALPFGAVGSVASFLRISAAIAFVGTLGLRVLWTVYFDDYSTVCLKEEAEQVTFFVHSLFKLLGIWFAETGEKAPPFAVCFKTLGLQVDLATLVESYFTIGHTQSRRVELVASLEELLQTRSAGTKQLERIHGRLVWFNSYIFGRRLNMAMKVLSKLSRSQAKVVRLEQEHLEACQFLLKGLQDAKPTVVRKNLACTWYVFTDGAFEGSLGSIGAVLVNPQGHVLEFFGEPIPKTFLEALMQTSTHPIYELEILPVNLAARLWSKYLISANVVFYLDNESARSAYIRGDATSSIGRAIVQDFLEWEWQTKINPWFGRVPTSSNLGDDVSRLNFNVPWLKHALRRSVVVPSHFGLSGVGIG